MRITLVCFVLISLIASARAQTGSSFITSDGLNRAPASVLHCANSANVAIPCGTAGQPVYVASGAGLANTANQVSQITASQATANAAGTQIDPAYSGGAGSMIALLKGVFGVLSNGIVATPVAGTPLSRSISVPASTSTMLFPANASRHYIALQAPSAGQMWVNFVGGPAMPNGTDCIFLTAGALYESGQFVTRGSVSVYTSTTTLITAWEG